MDFESAAWKGRNLNPVQYFPTWKDSSANRVHFPVWKEVNGDATNFAAWASIKFPA